MDKELKDILLCVDKPARYCGGEFNTPVIKENASLRFLMCFPDVYEVAHSNLGIKILYYMLNNRPDVACESCYTPWTDMIAALKEHNMPLFSQETHSPVCSFDAIGFSLQYEMSYTNVLCMLDLGGIPLLSEERGEGTPIVVAGGPCTVNPMPLAKSIDVFSIGDGEEAINNLADTLILCKKEKKTRAETLCEIAKIDGMFVPSVPQTKVRRAVIDSLDGAFYPRKVQIPNIEAVFNRAVLEIFRGCTRGCRFCQAGMIYRPVRERTVETLAKYTRELIDNNGFDELTLSSLSTCDYPQLRQLLREIKPLCDERHVNISLPSTRVDSFEAEYVASARLSSLTFAPEAGTQRLRDVINKNVTEEDVLTSCRYAFEKGYHAVKLYFMIGLPTETDEDLLGIAELVKKIKACYKANAVSKKALSLVVSTSTFVPKPFTPFQWEAQISLDEIERRQGLLKTVLRPLGVKYSYHDGKTSRLETTLARGDERMNDVLLAAYTSGCIFDSWTDLFDYDKWMAAFEKCGVDAEDYCGAQSLEKTLPWERVETGISRAFLLCEREKAYKGELTHDCRKGCNGCGIAAEYPSAFKENCTRCVKNADL
ncbi:MAG: TIGR03960 family B12-binding radical SAM protein [Clostridiales bacterium]|nr:TIGR03960 family B12-binding radical SAM protein [Clostridiales bacterium]